MGVILPHGTAARAGVEGGCRAITDNDPYFKACRPRWPTRAFWSPAPKRWSTGRAPAR